VLRTRDREELAALSRELHEERERRTVLDGTLRQTEDQMQGELSALREAHQAERRQLEEEVAQAADRLHEVAHATQVLEARLELQLAERAAERDRLMDNALVGYGTFTREGRLTRCSATFASMLGYPSAEDAMEMHDGGVFPGTPDHARVLSVLEQPGAPGTGRIESIVRRHDGRPVRVLTSAVLVPAARNGADEDLVERLFVDLTDRARAETELRLARRLESVGRLTAEMAPQIEAALAAADDPGGNPADREHLALLVRQLLAFSQLQAKPAGYLSLNDAIARCEPQLRQLAGDAIDLQLRLGEIEPIAAGEDDIEHLVLELVSTMAGCLPFGGRLTISTATDTDPTFVLRTLLSASAAGYGVLPVHLPSSLARLVARSGGVVQESGDAGRTSMLHVLLPC
jgi:PAS domain-containing protein